MVGCFYGSRITMRYGGELIIGNNCGFSDVATIAAGSVIVKYVPADSVAGGNPAKVIKYLKE